MKRFLSAVAFCVFLLVFGLLVLLPSAAAEKNLLQNLLNLPAPPPPNSLVRTTRRIYAGNMIERDTPPDDDAPIEELFAYWQRENYSFQETGYNRKPSAQALRRIMEEVGEHPEKLNGVLNILPEDAETQNFVKQLYDRQSADEDSDRERDSNVKEWLTYHSPYFSGELLKAAETVSDTDEYVTNQKELLALARVDWEKARPILERLANDDKQPISQTLARWAFYQHAVKENDSSDIEKYRKQLQATVKNKSEKPGNRDLAMDALVEAGDFEGRDDWYFSLLDDETLYDLRVNGTSYTGLTTLLARSPRDKYVTKMVELAASNNPTIRRAAVRNLTTLLDTKNPEVVRALLPWLENPEWAQEVSGERRRLVAALTNMQMPESVPGLIAVLNEKQPAEVYTSSNPWMMNSNVMATNSNRVMSANRVVSNVGSTGYEYAYRSEAISALAVQKDMRAIAPLRELLPQVEGWQVGNIVRALLASNGFSVFEQTEALELVAKNYIQPGETSYAGNVAVVVNTMDYDGVATARVMSNTMMMNGNYTAAKRPFSPTDIKPVLGQQLVNQPAADENLVAALIERINILDTKDPPVAFGLRKIMQNWRGAAINALLMRDVKNNKTDTDAVVKLLSLRKELREKQSNEVFDMRNGSATAIGISICLMENPTDYETLLQSENVEAKTAMLACARLIRAALPVRKVAEHLKSPNKTLALAAERYLETEDSPEAQNFVLALHPNEAKILGAKRVFTPDDAPVTNSVFLPALFASIESLSGIPGYYYYNYSDDLAAEEKRLQKEVKGNPELLGVYAYDDNFIRIYKDKAVFSWQSDKARFRERDLSKEEFDAFKNYLAAERVNELPPFFSECKEGCGEKELLMLGRNGGRRIFLVGDESPKFFADLAAMLERMRQPPAKLRYALEKDLAGLEILFEDENLQAETVWKNGADFRVLVSDETRRRQIDKELEKQDIADEEKEDADYEQIWKNRRTRRAQREYENFAWHRIADGKLVALADQPANIEFVPKYDGAAVRAEKGQWKARTTAFEIRADSDGLYKVAGGRMTKLADGYYEKPVVTPNGRWVIVTKYDGEEGIKLVRFNLLTKKELTVPTGDYPRFTAVANVASVNKILILGSGYGSEEGEETEEEVQSRGEFYLLDAETGAVSKPKGEIRPLAQQNYRALQSNGKPDEFWAAISDAAKEETGVGIYNAKTLTFKSILRIPQIQFNSMQMWIDADKVYFVYQGHLLDLPLPK